MNKPTSPTSLTDKSNHDNLNSKHIRRILMVDDDPDDQYLTHQALKTTQLYFEIDFVENGQEMLDYLECKTKEVNALPDMILLDLNMPEMDGMRALQELRKLGLQERIHIVVFSTSNSNLDIDEAYEHGAKYFLTKPSGFDELSQKINDLCKHWF